MMGQSSTNLHTCAGCGMPLTLAWKVNGGEWRCMNLGCLLGAQPPHRNLRVTNSEPRTVVEEVECE